MDGLVTTVSTSAPIEFIASKLQPKAHSTVAASDTTSTGTTVAPDWTLARPIMSDDDVPARKVGDRINIWWDR